LHEEGREWLSERRLGLAAGAVETVWRWTMVVPLGGSLILLIHKWLIFSGMVWGIVINITYLTGLLYLKEKKLEAWTFLILKI
jgi:hypothetical protein